MKIDYHPDFADFYTYLVERVRSFDPASNDGPGEAGPVKRVDVGFGYGYAGWISVVFDTRPDAEPDGEWNAHIEGNCLERPNWQWEEESEESQPITIVQADGKTSEIPEEDEVIAEHIGEILKAALLKARADGVFEGLLKSPGCELGIEEQDGNYGWPVYEERGQENLA